ncbi:DUF3221 domain-containing protein [Filobacillus milosensis]|uniref:DUF3221 domain-containing protein n=1 Tax=Filobacillus milosensis TaxID=94137 RepID=A0A4Y8ISJ2_9BACI|nr:DUF3221 domain-containing protein [Filobacillus milosensis]TFB23900.1 DUF3221 domain-containing protein [Filobacillus milosensis]
MISINSNVKQELKFFMIFILVILILIVAWTTYNAINEPDGMKMEGYIIDIKEERILVAKGVTESEYKQLKNQSVKELMENEVDLIYLDYKSSKFNKGNHVQFWVTGVNASYPAQATPEKIIKLE